jgi:nicotinate-nucleotide adenylyltransferase
MRIGFFGGSFDPPHLGHLTVARAAAAACSLDRILFAPTANQPLKPVGAAAPYDERLHMVALLCGLQNTLPHFEPSTLDAPNPDGAPNFTVDTLTRLRQSLQPTDDIFAIVGADAFADIARWRSPNTLLQLAQWIAVSRPSSAAQPAPASWLSVAQRKRVHHLDGVDDPASATAIRDLLRRGSDCPALLPPSILRYIRAHHLYGT